MAKLENRHDKRFVSVMNSRPVIALLTDFGLQDQYVAAMKGVIKSINPAVDIIDISHEIQPYRIRQAAYVLWSVYKYFPKGSIFINIVDPGVGSKRRIVIIKTKRFIFLAPDNGLLDFILHEEKVLLAIEVTEKTVKKYILNKISSSFHGRDIFAPIAAYISIRFSIKRFGVIIKLPVVISPFADLCTNAKNPCILHIDHYGNIITNIRSHQIEESMKEIKALSIGHNMVSKWIRFYEEAPENTPCLMVGSCGLIEISVKKNSAARLLTRRLIQN